MDRRTAELMHELDTLRQVIAKECPPRSTTLSDSTCKELNKRFAQLSGQLAYRMHIIDPNLDHTDYTTTFFCSPFLKKRWIMDRRNREFDDKPYGCVHRRQPGPWDFCTSGSVVLGKGHIPPLRKDAETLTGHY